MVAPDGTAVPGRLVSRTETIITSRKSFVDGCWLLRFDDSSHITYDDSRERSLPEVLQYRV